MQLATPSAHNPKGLTAITETIQTAGAIVFWRINGGFNLDTLRTAWEAEGLVSAWLPDVPTPAVALRRAVNGMRDSATLVRALKGGGYAIVEEWEIDGELEYRTLFKVRLDKVGRLQFTDRAGGSHKERLLVETAYEEFLVGLIPQDVSPWLCDIMDKIGSVPLRDTGGVYFVPRFAMESWEAILRALRSCSEHAIASVPALRSDEAAAAVIDAVSIEANRAADALSRELQETTMGSRAIESRIATADGVEAKVVRYEKLFGSHIAGLHERLQELRASLAVAMMKAQQRADEEAEAARV